MTVEWRPRKLIRSNDAVDARGLPHHLDWSGANADLINGQRSSGLTGTCSCGWQSDTGSEASVRREFTHHINTTS